MLSVPPPSSVTPHFTRLPTNPISVWPYQGESHLESHQQHTVHMQWRGRMEIAPLGTQCSMEISATVYLAIGREGRPHQPRRGATLSLSARVCVRWPNGPRQTPSTSGAAQRGVASRSLLGPLARVNALRTAQRPKRGAGPIPHVIGDVSACTWRR